MPRWLLLQDPPLSGETNMGRDRNLYTQFPDCPYDGLLRFFRWEQPTLSLGRFQEDSELEKRCQILHLPVVRRPTGGQAILHGSDLCWSVISHTQGPLGKDLHATYQSLAQIAIMALAELGIRAQFSQTHEAYRKQASCFASLTPADLEVAGKKLIGSAQMRNRRVFLQQSSLRLSPPKEETLLFPDALSRPQSSLSDWLPNMAPELLVSTLTQAFAQALNLSFESPPADLELS